MGKQSGWRRLLVVAPPFHLPRAAMTTASVAGRELPTLSVHTLSGGPLPWEEVSAHSQGMVATRYEFLDAELERIERYMLKGDIASSAELERRFARPVPAVAHVANGA